MSPACRAFTLKQHNINDVLYLISLLMAVSNGIACFMERTRDHLVLLLNKKHGARDQTSGICLGWGLILKLRLKH